ncbi:MAG: HepT-like ribonuclease domain-containing protein [Bacteroidota bacterium]
MTSILDIFEVHLAGIQHLREFEQQKTVRRAVAKEIEIIGEAASRLRKEGLTLKMTDSLINRRNTLIHQYGDFKDETIWYFVQSELPLLKEEVDRLLG